MHPSYSASFPYCSELAVQRRLGNLIDSYMNSTATTTTMMKRKKDWFILKLAIRKQDIFCVKKIPFFLWKYLTCIWITSTTNFYAMLFKWNTYILFVNNKNSCQNAFLFRHESQFFSMIFPWFFLASCSFFVLLLRFATFEQRIFCHKIKKREWSWPSQQNKICFTWMTFSCFKQLAVFIYVFFCSFLALLFSLQLNLLCAMMRY